MGRQSRTFGTGDVPVTFTSDEYNGITVDNQGNVRTLRPRSFTSLAQAENDNGHSRISLGVLWSFDREQGIERRSADYVFQNLYLPRT